MAALILPSRRIASAYPSGTPAIDWDNPITKGLRGFLWCGGPRPVDLVEPLTQWLTSGATRIQGGRGPVTSVTGALTGIYTPRNSVAPLGSWAVTQLPVSLFGFFSFSTVASTRSLLQVGYGGGVALLDAYGARARYARSYVDGTARAAEAGTWSSGETVRGMVVLPTEMVLYDEGVPAAYSAGYAGSYLTYPTPYSRVSFLGDPDATPVTGTGYWAGMWARGLSAGEARSLQAQPFQMLRSQPRKFFLVSSGGALNLVGSGAAQAATSGTGAIIQAHALASSTSTQGATSSAAAITQTHILVANPVAQAATSGTGAIAQAHQLVAQACAQAASSSAAAITQGSAITLAGAACNQAAVSGTGLVTQYHQLVAAPSVQDAVASASAIVQAHLLAAAACVQAATSGVGSIADEGDLATAATVLYCAPSETRVYAARLEARAYTAPGETRIYKEPT